MSSPKSIHIISLDVPYPADYGGAVDIYHRIRALAELGYKINLHCYEYGRGEPKELISLTENVFYYTRKKKVLDWINPLPFIVQTRKSQRLLDQLQMDDAPILFEGLHTTFFLNHPELNSRVKIVRTHNIEHDYYERLAQDTLGWKKRFYLSEAKKLKKYEQILKNASHILAIKPSDKDYFSRYQPSCYLLPPCIEAVEPSEQLATEPFALFHGNLSVTENERAVRWFVEHLVPNNPVKIVVAGKNPSPELKKLLIASNVTLYANPSQEKLTEILSKARVHLMKTDQATGVKLKLMHALLTSGHILANHLMLEGTFSEELCIRVESHQEWLAALNRLIKTPLSPNDFEKRQAWISEHFNTTENCRIFDQLLFG